MTLKHEFFRSPTTLHTGDERAGKPYIPGPRGKSVDPLRCRAVVYAKSGNTTRASADGGMQCRRHRLHIDDAGMGWCDQHNPRRISEGDKIGALLSARARRCIERSEGHMRFNFLVHELVDALRVMAYDKGEREKYNNLFQALHLCGEGPAPRRNGKVQDGRYRVSAEAEEAWQSAISAREDSPS